MLQIAASHGCEYKYNYRGKIIGAINNFTTQDRDIITLHNGEKYIVHDCFSLNYLDDIETRVANGEKTVFRGMLKELKNISTGKSIYVAKIYKNGNYKKLTEKQVLRAYAMHHQSLEPFVRKK